MSDTVLVTLRRRQGRSSRRRLTDADIDAELEAYNAERRSAPTA